MHQPERTLGVVLAIAALLLVGWHGQAGTSPAFIRSAGHELVAAP